MRCGSLRPYTAALAPAARAVVALAKLGRERVLLAADGPGHATDVLSKDTGVD